MSPSLPEVRSVLCRRVYFQCVHKYSSHVLSPAENLAEFGACYSPHGHGHNYTLDVYVEGPIEPTTGMVINLRDLDLVLQKTVARLDQRHLNFEVDEFKEKNPTTENIALYLHSHIKNELKIFPVHLKQIRLYESEDLWVDYIE